LKNAEAADLKRHAECTLTNSLQMVYHFHHHRNKLTLQLALQKPLVKVRLMKQSLLKQHASCTSTTNLQLVCHSPIPSQKQFDFATCLAEAAGEILPDEAMPSETASSVYTNSSQLECRLHHHRSKSILWLALQNPLVKACSMRQRL